MRSRHVARAPEPDAVQTRAAAVADHRHVARDDRRGHFRPVARCLRIEVAALPEQLSIRRIMGRQMDRAPNQQGLFALVAENQRRGIAVVALGRASDSRGPPSSAVRR